MIVTTASGPMAAIRSGNTYAVTGEPVDIDAPYLDRGVVVHLPKGQVIYGTLNGGYARALLASDGLPQTGPVRFPEGV